MNNGVNRHFGCREVSTLGGLVTGELSTSSGMAGSRRAWWSRPGMVRPAVTTSRATSIAPCAWKCVFSATPSG
ncbi:hypothetical protein [Actinoplanes siamensis]|uniref:hypothetical protein n=1 Tax=Actinoplanes siamensis TaxID=1223317 RepID=UPI001940E4BC|nr:hypothetical protein [Actinoplanes siamensis]